MSQSIFFAWMREKTAPSNVPGAAAGTVSIPTSALTLLYRQDVRNWSRGMFTIVNGANALQAFQVQMKTHQDGPVIVVMSAAADFATPDNIFLGITMNDASGNASTATDMTSMAANYAAMMGFDLRGIAEISFWAQASGGASAMAAYGGAN